MGKGLLMIGAAVEAKEEEVIIDINSLIKRITKPTYISSTIKEFGHVKANCQAKDKHEYRGTTFVVEEKEVSNPFMAHMDVDYSVN